MATTADHPASREAARASRDQELTARFVNDTLTHLNQLSARARRLTHNAVVSWHSRGTVAWLRRSRL
jgi:hypothetical protein